MKRERAWIGLVVLLIHVAVGLLSIEKFALEKYYADRYFISKEDNGTTIYTVSRSREEAFAKFSAFSLNCTFPDDVNEISCEKLDNKLCESTSSGSWKNFGFHLDSCHCDLDECEDDNSTAAILYPGCFCNRHLGARQCDFLADACPQWTETSNTPILKIKAFKHATFGSFAQAGSQDTYLHKKTASLLSSVFRQSGLNCTLNFWHHFKPQSGYSKLVVRSHLVSGQSRVLYEYYRGPPSLVWLPASVSLGSFNQPFSISISCETGTEPKRKKPRVMDKDGNLEEIFSCGIAALSFDSCEDIRDPVGTCSHGDQFLCSSESNTRCLTDSQCDMKADCEDLSDEIECDHVYGSNCDFNGPNNALCTGWKQYTRILDVMENQFQVTTRAPTNAFSEIPKWLWKRKSPSSKYKIQKEARKGAGSFLSFESEEAEGLSRRTSVLVSPEFPRTNPFAYDRNSKYFETCRLRFYVCAKAFLTSWHISIISRNADNEKRPFDGGRTSLFEPKAYESASDLKATCEWERVLINVPRQNGKFRLGIFVEHYKDQNDILAIDDLSFSPSCFEKEINESTWQTPDLLVSSCGATGFEKPESCKEFRVLDGQSGHFLQEDGTQEWTVPVAGFYRVEACGAAGGSANSRDGDRGECVTLQVHFRENIALRMLVGQMGESACFDQDEDMRPASCAKSSKNQQRSARQGGGGGGGATLITVESGLWNVVVGGGAGASWDSSDNFAGYGSSIILVDVDERCSDVCRTISHTDFQVDKNENQCPGRKENTVLGGFGGGGNSCGLRGGSGAGYRGGNPFGRGRERSGSSNVTASFAREVGYYQAEKVEDGYIKISFCRRQCTLPSVCRFKKDHFEEEYCGCPDGSEYDNSTKSCLCLLDCPSGATCQYRNFTSETMCLCDNGKHINDFDHDYCEEAQPWMWYNYLLFFFLLIVLACAFAIIFHYKNRAKKIKEELINLNLITASRYQYDDIYFGMQTRKEAIKDLPFIPRESVKLGKVLGRGNFGEVQYGEYEDKKLAVKIISKPFSASLSAQADFCNEALCMGTFVDENVVQLVGVDFEEIPYLIALEFMEGGDLLSFVKESRPNHTSLNPFHLAMADLIKICSDVASGCKCLEGFKYVHRDIAARNILLTTRSHGRVAKIADFGMAKEIKNDREYYRVHGRAMLPIKWTPPEAFIDGVFTTKSDVWSFGILCWEVFSLGVVPYPNRRNEEVMLMLTEGARLEYPYGIPTRIYQLMRACWRTDPESRPEFSEISGVVDDILNDPAAVRMPFPIHPTVRTSYAHAQSTPVSVETPQTAITEISMSSAFTDASTVRVAAQQDVQDRIKLHEMMLTREQPYTSEMTVCVIDHIRKDLARAQFETGTTSVPQPEYLSPDSTDESVQMIPNGVPNVLTEQTPPTSMLNLSHLAVQNTGPTLHRPDSLNFHNQYSAVPLLECQTN